MSFYREARPYSPPADAYTAHPPAPPPSFAPEVVDTLRDIVELGALSITDGRIVAEQTPADNLYTENHWRPTCKAARWLSERGKLPDGEYFVCLYDGWRECSRYVPPLRRRYVDWGSLRASGVSRFMGRGVSGEPRFAHDPADHGLYPVLCRKVLAYARHRGDPTVVLLPDAEFVYSIGYLPFVSATERTLLPEPSARLTPATPLYWRGSRNTDVAVMGAHRPGMRQAVVGSGARGLDVAFTSETSRVTIEEQLRASPLQLDLDGMVGAWSGRFWKLLSPGIVPLRPHTPWEQWYDHRLVPWQHYVPVMEPGERERGGGGPGERGLPFSYEDYDITEPSTAALELVRHWCLAHPSRCDEIADEGCRFARTLLEEHRSLLYGSST